MQGFTSYLKVRVFVHLERLLLSFEAVTSSKVKRMRCDTFGSCVSVSFCVCLSSLEKLLEENRCSLLHGTQAPMANPSYRPSKDTASKRIRVTRARQCVYSLSHVTSIAKCRKDNSSVLTLLQYFYLTVWRNQPWWWRWNSLWVHCHSFF